MWNGRLLRCRNAARAALRWPVALILALILMAQVTVSALALRIGPFASAPQGRITMATRDALGAPPAVHSLATATPGATATPTPSLATATGSVCAVTQAQTDAEQHVVALLNAHRAAVGVAPLVVDPTLADVARAHSCDMLQHQLMSHTGSDGSSPFQRIQSAGIHYRTAGENIGTATNYGLIGGLDMNDQNMMAEPLTPYDHHWNIINAGYTRTGIGVIYANGQEWLTEDFVG